MKPRLEPDPEDDDTRVARQTREQEHFREERRRVGAKLDAPDQFRGNLSGWLQWAPRNWPGSPSRYWCFTHWAPVPVEGKDGHAATTALRRHAEAAISGRNQIQVDTWVANQSDNLCCILGDEVVNQIWSDIRARP